MRGAALLIAAVAVTLAVGANAGARLHGAEIDGSLRATASIGTDLFAHLWTAPIGGGDQCYFLTVDRRETPRTKSASPPAGCTRVDHLRPTAAHRLGYTITGPEHACLGGRASCKAQGRTVIYGEIEALSPVARVAALGSGRSLPVTVRGHWLLGTLSSRPDNRYKHWRLVAYGGHGEILGRIYF